MRFYPDIVPVFPHEPHRNQFDITSASDRGEGVISLQDFKGGDFLCAFTGFLLPVISLYTLQVAKGAHIHDPYFMGKLLHSCEPNIMVDTAARIITATQRIFAGQYLMMDYESTEAVLYRQFDCLCGSSQCRGRICGYEVSAPRS